MNATIQIGVVCEVQGGRFNNTSNYVVEGYDERGYMTMRDQRDTKITMTLHPGHVARIASNLNGDSGIKVLNCENLNYAFVRQTEVQVPVAVQTPVKTVSIPESDSSMTKKERAAAIKAAHSHLSRKEVIQLFIEQLGMTTAGASTYYSYK